jgi:hypothetical protein
MSKMNQNNTLRESFKGFKRIYLRLNVIFVKKRRIILLNAFNAHKQFVIDVIMIEKMKTNFVKFNAKD